VSKKKKKITDTTSKGKEEISSEPKNLVYNTKQGANKFEQGGVIAIDESRKSLGLIRYPLIEKKLNENPKLVLILNVKDNEVLLNLMGLEAKVKTLAKESLKLDDKELDSLLKDTTKTVRSSTIDSQGSKDILEKIQRKF